MTDFCSAATQRISLNAQMQRIDFSIVQATLKHGGDVQRQSPALDELSFRSSISLAGDVRTSWCSEVNATFPQKLVVKIHRLHSQLPRIRVLQLLMHNYKIASRIELWHDVTASTSSTIIETLEDRNVCLQRIGQVYPAVNDGRGHRARELRTIPVAFDAAVEYLYFVLHEPYHNVLNTNHQIALVDICLLGEVTVSYNEIGQRATTPQLLTDLPLYKRPSSAIYSAITPLSSIEAMRISELRSFRGYPYYSYSPPPSQASDHTRFSSVSPSRKLTHLNSPIEAVDALLSTHVNTMSIQDPVPVIHPSKEISQSTPPLYSGSLITPANIDQATQSVSPPASEAGDTSMNSPLQGYELATPVFGQDVIYRFASRNFLVKEQAMSEIKSSLDRRLRQDLLDSEVDTAVVKATLTLVHKSLPEVREKVLTWGFSWWHAALDIAQKADLPPAAYFHTMSVDIPLLMVKCGDGNIRIRNLARELLIRLTVTFHSTYSILPYLIKPRKVRVPWRQLEALLDVIRQTVSILGIKGCSDRDDGALDLMQLKTLIMGLVTHTTAAVRDAAIACLLEVAKIAGRRKVEPWILSITQRVLAETIRRRLIEASAPPVAQIAAQHTKFRSTKSASNIQYITSKSTPHANVTSLQKFPTTPIRRVPLLSSSARKLSKVTTPKANTVEISQTPRLKKRISSVMNTCMHINDQGIFNNNVPLSNVKCANSRDTDFHAGSAFTNVEEQSFSRTTDAPANVDTESTCIFCDTRLLGDKQTMDIHYRNACPMLCKCKQCHNIVELATYNDHAVTECIAGAFYVCVLCKRVTAKNDQAHSLHCVVGQGTCCPLCNEPLKGEWEDALRNHMMTTSGCSAAETLRRPPLYNNTSVAISTH